MGSSRVAAGRTPHTGPQRTAATLAPLVPSLRPGAPGDEGLCRLDTETARRCLPSTVGLTPLPASVARPFLPSDVTRVLSPVIGSNVDPCVRGFPLITV